MEYPYECDLLRFKESGTVYEYEIKTSKSDYLADFKKSWYKENKHQSLKDGKLLPNYFFFVLPEGMVSKSEIPDHCGLLEYSYRPPSDFGKGYISIKLTKNAKRLHNRRFDKWHSIAKRMAFRDNEKRKFDFYKATERNKKAGLTGLNNIPAIIIKSMQQ